MQWHREYIMHIRRGYLKKEKASQKVRMERRKRMRKENNDWQWLFQCAVRGTPLLVTDKQGPLRGLSWWRLLSCSHEAQHCGGGGACCSNRAWATDPLPSLISLSQDCPWYPVSNTERKSPETGNLAKLKNQSVTRLLDKLWTTNYH